MELTTGAGSATSGPTQTRLLAVMAADVVDYTRLTEAAELETHARLRALRVGIIDPCVVSYRGQIIKNTGDGFLATFDSSVDALRCAVEIQHEIPLREASTPPDLRIRLRIGLNVGEVITEKEDIYGTSVNVAARLEQFSPPGGIVISEALHAVARSKMDVPSEDLGELALKNLSRPVHAFSLRLAGVDTHAAPVSQFARRPKLPGVAVFPSRLRGDAPGRVFCGEGFFHAIFSHLARGRGLLVIARTWAFAYRHGPVDLLKIGKELGVRYVLSGSVRRIERRLRITAE